MFTRVRWGAFGVLVLLGLSSCVESGVVEPDVADTPTPSLAILDGSTSGSDDFYFLPPLVGGAPTITGQFNPELLPWMRVCLLDMLLGSCVDAPPVVIFPPGSAVLGDEQYQISWDTDGPETGPIDTSLFYRLEILVADSVLGWIELDPQDPDGPGQSTADAYAFRLGEVIPVKFWLDIDVLCATEEYVTECITGAVIDEAGGDLFLDQAGDRLSLIVFEGGLPGENHPPVTVTIERIDPELFAAATGEECIPMFDAPQFADCFRVTTIPVVDEPLDLPALVSICLDPFALGLSEEQQDELTMVRFEEGEWEALPDAAGDCPTTSASLVPEPERGLLRHAARGLNALADLILPEPVAASDIRFGGFSSSFSRFRYTLPAQVVVTEGDGAVLQASDSDEVAAVVQVVDRRGDPVSNATVHFTTSDGTVSVSDATTDGAGFAGTTWSVNRGSPGAKSMTVSALGLFDGPVPEHSQSVLITPITVDLTATVVGPPAALTQAPVGNIEGTAGESAGELTIAVVDEGGNPVAGAAVSWTGDGTVVGGTQTDVDGTATGEWILPETAGENTVTASVGSQTASFTATGAAGPAVEPAYSDPPATGVAGLALAEPLAVTVTDQFGNPREGDAVSWTVTSGGGSLSETASVTGADGSVQVAWTLGQTAGENVVTVEVAGFSTTFTVQGVAGDAVQPGGSGSGQAGVVGQPLSQALGLTLTDQFGNPVEGAAVSWSGDGTLSPAATQTDALGVAQVTWTLGTVAGTQGATASVGGFSVAFTAEAAPGPAASLATTGGGGSAFAGSVVVVGVTVADAFGNVRAGDAVTWTVAGGGGSIAGDGATGPSGSASAAWTLGAVPGPNTATVLAGGLQETFAVEGVCFDGYGIAQIDGVFDASEWACASVLPFSANISGGSTDAEVYWMNDADNLYLAVRVLQSAMARANDVRFDFDNDADGVAEVDDDVIGYDADEALFFDESLDQGCVNRNQSGCSVGGEPVDGEGAVANDGTWTVYELSHPLSSGDPKDFSVAKDEMLGFFLTLRIGNGAQGDTQVPGFRQYANVTVVGN